jgi:dephospho-CoA kinase
VGKWKGKYVIGLTGNIGTGKTVVRRMLEHLGAYGIDADALSHRVIARGGPGYPKVLEVFGQWLLKADGEIDRKKLGRVVFDDPAALKRLEGIIHPYVIQAIDILINRATQPVVVVEAIKLEDLRLDKACDSIWVTTAPLDMQLARLSEKRKMSRHEAMQRINAQPTKEARVASSSVIIRNDGSFEDTWSAVNAAWRRFVPADVSAPATVIVPRKQTSAGVMSVLRGMPRHSSEIAELMNRILPGANLSRMDIMAAFGEKAFLLLQVGESLQGLIAWQVENLVSRTHDIVLDAAVPPDQALPLLFKEMENASRDLQAEAALVFVPDGLAKLTKVWEGLGYMQRETDSLGVTAWQQAAQDAQPANTVLFFKQLRVDRVLRPM